MPIARTINKFVLTLIGTCEFSTQKLPYTAMIDADSSSNLACRHLTEKGTLSYNSIFFCHGHRENANDIRAKFIIEAANHPTDPEADEVNVYF